MVFESKTGRRKRKKSIGRTPKQTRRNISEVKDTTNLYPDVGVSSQTQKLLNHRIAQKRYISSEKGIKTRERYAKTKHGMSRLAESQKRYASTKNGKECQKRYAATKNGKECQKRYASTKNGKECQKRYASTENGKRKRKECKKRYASNLLESIKKQVHEREQSILARFNRQHWSSNFFSSVPAPVL